MSLVLMELFVFWDSDCQGTFPDHLEITNLDEFKGLFPCDLGGQSIIQLEFSPPTFGHTIPRLCIWSQPRSVGRRDHTPG